ncbi:hypothetical protein SARC_05917 [Sphaeroforma arctica JP610]|uniref:Uncharacterized protein n=1 Tax=Sphaeroforma arctica JP610 TaxID=667725 RepID=A0A0L0FYQ9_9EUKA|nr:hypothetical protein SARC_05917 [Sphaeroforma arctica JP610]KNC81769.1 hypothetical protein SARC_05917 [Sphaeroforma arctica JP610]|eukprot:XP_014155671.1 hypothetical protein SARC_05917 [Sphaeroforma arctica JP610]
MDSPSSDRRPGDGNNDEYKYVSEAIREKTRMCEALELEIVELQKELAAQQKMHEKDGKSEVAESTAAKNIIGKIASTPEARELIPPWLMNVLDLYAEPTSIANNT